MTADRIVIERTFDAPLADVWELWTTPAGLEAWWGPEGFTVTVQELDLRPGGRLRYTMTATGAPQVAFMREHGMPIATPCSVTYTEVAPMRRLAWENLVDFVPGHEAYETGTVVELFPTPAGVRLVMTLDPMHAPEWNQRMVAGWESELGKLGAALRTRS